HIPLPGIGMDFRIVHPIPLAVSDVVPEFHVLDAFGRGQGSGSQGPTDFAFGSGDDQPRRNVKPTLKSDRTRDVRPIPGTARSLDITTDLVQLGRERGEVRVAEMGVLGYVSDGRRDPLPGLGERRRGDLWGLPACACRVSASTAASCVTSDRRIDTHPATRGSVRLQVGERSRLSDYR